MRRGTLLPAVVLAVAGLPAAAGGQAPHDGAPHGGAAPGAPATSPPAPAGTVTVGMRGRIFSPSRITVLAGERVTWVNDDTTVHDVATVDEGGFDLGRLSPGASYAQVFDTQGTVRYRCTLHRFMLGTIDVFALALEGPAGSVPSGRSAVLSGRAPEGTSELVIEALDITASAWHPVAEVPVKADGTFAASLIPERSTTYRARAGALSSAPARVGVAARLDAHAHRMSGGRIRVEVHAEPGQPGASAVLQRYDRERFDWRPAGRARRLDAASHAGFTIRSRHRERLRVVLPRGAHGFAPAASRAVVVRAMA